MMYAIGRCFVLASLSWASTMTNSVGATSPDNNSKSECQPGLQETPSTSTAQDTTYELDTFPKNMVCTGRQYITLTCVPPSFITGLIYWEYWTKTARCHNNGSTNAAHHTLTIPCDSYSVQCLMKNPPDQDKRSQVIHITKDYEVEAELYDCIEGEFNSVTFFCHAPVKDVMSTRWFVGGEECPSKFTRFNGLRLDLPCMSNYDQEEVTCEVQFSGGIVNKTVGWIQVNESNSYQTGRKKVNEINGVTPIQLPTTTPTPEQDTKKTIQLTPKELSIAIAVVLFAFLVILVSMILLTVWITQKCTRRTKEENIKDDETKYS